MGAAEPLPGGGRHLPGVWIASADGSTELGIPVGPIARDAGPKLMVGQWASAHVGQRRRQPVTGHPRVQLPFPIAPGPGRLGQVGDGPGAEGEELATQTLDVGARELG
jgi:hypothetical protein